MCKNFSFNKCVQVIPSSSIYLKESVHECKYEIKIYFMWKYIELALGFRLTQLTGLNDTQNHKNL